MSLITDAIAAVLLRSGATGSSGVKLPALFDPVNKVWVPAAGD